MIVNASPSTLANDARCFFSCLTGELLDAVFTLILLDLGNAGTLTNFVILDDGGRIILDGGGKLILD